MEQENTRVLKARNEIRGRGGRETRERGGRETRGRGDNEIRGRGGTKTLVCRGEWPSTLPVVSIM
ncbi:MAG: hypothetical protein ACREBG_01340 [Pyrinomonadaceae bacterium]